MQSTSASAQSENRGPYQECWRLQRYRTKPPPSCHAETCSSVPEARPSSCRLRSSCPPPHPVPVPVPIVCTSAQRAPSTERGRSVTPGTPLQLTLSTTGVGGCWSLLPRFVSSSSVKGGKGGWGHHYRCSTRITPCSPDTTVLFSIRSGLRT